jgi:hypothetical protein
MPAFHSACTTVISAYRDVIFSNTFRTSSHLLGGTNRPKVAVAMLLQEFSFELKAGEEIT